MSSGPVEVLRPNASAAVPGAVLAGILLAIFVTIWAGLLGSWIVTAAGYPTLGALVAPVVGLVVLVGVAVWGYLKVKSTRYEIHEEKIRKESGLLSTSITDVEFEDVTDVQYDEAVVHSFYDVGTISLNTAGGDDKELKMKYIDDAREFYEELNESYT